MRGKILFTHFICYYYCLWQPKGVTRRRWNLFEIINRPWHREVSTMQNYRACFQVNCIHFLKEKKRSHWAISLRGNSIFHLATCLPGRLSWQGVNGSKSPLEFHGQAAIWTRFSLIWTLNFQMRLSNWKLKKFKTTFILSPQMWGSFSLIWGAFALQV